MTITSTKKGAPEKAAAFKRAVARKKAADAKKPASTRRPAGAKLLASAKLIASAKLVAVKKPASDKKASKPPQKPIEAARSAKARRELGSLDYIRSVRVAVEELGQAAVARALNVSQPAVSKLLSGAEARGVKPVAAGFSGAGPYEIAERYAAGDIDRNTMIRELTAWPYAKNEGAAAAAAEWESTPYMDTPGSFAEVGRAFDEGLIDGDAYDEILDASDEASKVG